MVKLPVKISPCVLEITGTTGKTMFLAWSAVGMEIRQLTGNPESRAVAGAGETTGFIATFLTPLIQPEIHRPPSPNSCWERGRG